MRSCEDERRCQEAQVHYYDLLCQEEAAVPAPVRRHVAACPVCQDRMRRLRETLLEAQRPESPAGAWQDETVEALAQQFQLLDERVTCSEARPLLPELALGSPQIRIPTPVTVHVDHCPQCAADLAAIRELHLTADQLKRLGRLLAAGRGVRLEGIGSVGTADAMKRGCRARDTKGGLGPAVPGVLSSQDTGIVCHDIVAADLFDRVLPSDSAPPRGTTAHERQQAVVRHVQSCPVCLGRMRVLQRTIGQIVARADSEVVTVYHAASDAEEASGEMEGEYPYPVSVQVLHRDSAAAAKAREVRAALATGLRKLARSAKPVAALVLIGVALTMLLRTTTPTASGTNAGDVDKVLAGIENTYIVTRDWNHKPIQEFWIARPSILVMKTGDDCVRYDLANDRRDTLHLQTDTRTSERLDSHDRDWALGIMAGYLRQMVAEVSQEARLRPAEGKMSNGDDNSWDVYELPLSSRARSSPKRSTEPAAAEASNPPLFNRRLVYIDRATGRPQKMESYRPVPGVDRKKPTTTTIFEYPTEPAMGEILRGLFPAE